VYRFRSFAIEVASEAQAYMDTMLALRAVQEWTKAGLAETLLIDRVEAI
jgi:glutathione S-transferase